MPTKYVLAGDIGGTNTRLAVHALARGKRLAVVRESTYSSRPRQGLEEVVEDFLERGRERIQAAAFGVAGPVVDGKVKTTNLPWVVSATTLAKVIGCKRVRLMNDLEAMAYGGLFLTPKEIKEINRGKRREGNCAVIAAGTGLGQAILFWHDGRHWPVATEGGHADFAPRNDKEVALLVYLQKKFPTVSYERVLSGPGLVNIFTFFDQELGRPVSPRVRERLKTDDPGQVIGEAGMAGTCPASVEAVETFLAIYGAQAGNLALSVMAVAGVFVGGAISAKMLAKMEGGLFMDAFRDKGRYRQIMSDIPVKVLLNADAGLVGASHAAAELA